MVLLHIAIVSAVVSLYQNGGQAQVQGNSDSTCQEKQQNIISLFGVKATLYHWYPSCLPGGYFQNVQCGVDGECFCAYVDTGNEIQSSKRSKTAQELKGHCPWLSKKHNNSCDAAPESFPCLKENERFYYNSDTKKCELRSNSCLGFTTMRECELACDVYVPPPIRCQVGKVDTTDGYSCIKESPGLYDKKCILCECKPGLTYSNDRKLCTEQVEQKKFSCDCERDGLQEFGGSDAENITVVRNTRREMILRCNAPKGSKQMKWSLNKIEFPDRCEFEKYCITKDGRYISIWKPSYMNSGLYKCQFMHRNEEAVLASTVIIPASTEQVCGKSPGIESPERSVIAKIIGGTMVKLGAAPFMALIKSTGRICGGSLVSTKYVLTAAHCLTFGQEKGIADPKIWEVFLGKMLLLETNEPFEQPTRVDKVIIHKDFDHKNYHADIALMKLKDQVYFSSRVKPVCIAKPSDSLSEIEPKERPNAENRKYGLVFGWGVTNQTLYSLGEHLMEAPVPIVPTDICLEKFRKKSRFGNVQISKLMFCAGGERRKDTCAGDAGGPFVLWSHIRSRWYLGGIISFGPHPCAQDGLPGVYTKIWTELRSWIYDNTDLVA